MPLLSGADGGGEILHALTGLTDGGNMTSPRAVPRLRRGRSASTSETRTPVVASMPTLPRHTRGEISGADSRRASRTEPCLMMGRRRRDGVLRRYHEADAGGLDRAVQGRGDAGGDGRCRAPRAANRAPRVSVDGRAAARRTTRRVRGRYTPRLYRGARCETPVMTIRTSVERSQPAA